jgi:hypothetical protein
MPYECSEEKEQKIMENWKNVISAALIGVATVAFLSKAQPVSINITGTVADSATSTGIAGANVKLVEYPQIIATTSSNGGFALTGAVAGVQPLKQQFSKCGEIRLDDKKLTIAGIDEPASVKIDVFLTNGARIFHKEFIVCRQEIVPLKNILKTAGTYCIKVRINSAEYSMVSSGNGRISFPVLSSGRSVLAKSAATYTIQVTAADYAGKTVSVSGATANAGTIKLSHLTIQTGVWVNVTPSGFLNSDFGAQDVLADPVRQGEVYAFTCNKGVWKSVDAGATWKKITSSGVMEAGRAWGECIDLNPSRDPATPPTLWACQGYGASGIFKSVDGGVTWTSYAVPFGGNTNADPYSPQVDPYDSRHIISGMHEANGVVESTDGGVTWRDVTGNMSGGISWYPFFINTGSASTTRSTWVAISQVTDGSTGTVRTTNGGASWSKVSGNEHPHGGAQIYQAGSGPVYMGGVYAAGGWGILKSTDFGQTWSHVGAVTSESNLFATPNHIYATCTGATTGLNDPHFQIGDPSGTTWTSQTVPPGMTNGPKNAAVTYDKSMGKYVLIGGCWNAGLWRYVEP